MLAQRRKFDDFIVECIMHVERDVYKNKHSMLLSVVQIIKIDDYNGTIDHFS